VLDIDMLLTPAGRSSSGGRSRSAELWGNTEYTLNADTGKMGLWPGGFFKFAAISVSEAASWATAAGSCR